MPNLWRAPAGSLARTGNPPANRHTAERLFTVQLAEIGVRACADRQRRARENVSNRCERCQARGGLAAAESEDAGDPLRLHAQDTAKFGRGA